MSRRARSRWPWPRSPARRRRRPPQPRRHSSSRLTRALTAPSLSLGRTAALAVDVATGTVIYAHNSSLPVAPASNEKIPVSWAALTSLGPGYRFHTEVYGTGTRAGATWDGDLILKGFGDPTLSTADLNRLAGTIAGRGIRTVTGRILGDESFYDRKRGAAGWKHYFIGGETPPLSALVVDRAPRLAGALAAAPRRTDVPRGAHASWRHGRRAAGPRRRSPGRDDAGIGRLRPALRRSSAT